MADANEPSPVRGPAGPGKLWKWLAGEHSARWIATVASGALATIIGGVVLVMLFGGSSSGGNARTGHPPPTTTSTTAPPPPSTTAGEPFGKDVLNRALIGLSDLPDGFTATSPRRDVDWLTIGELEACLDPVIAEGIAHRSDRDVFASDDEPFAVVSEAVSFYTGGAAKYLSEFQAQIADCEYTLPEVVDRPALGHEALRLVGVQNLDSSSYGAFVLIRIGTNLSMVGYARSYDGHEDLVLLEHLGRVAEQRLRAATGS